MNISPWAEAAIQLDDFVRDDKINAFVLGSKIAIEKAIQSKSKSGMCIKVSRKLFCEITERIMGWKYDGELNSFFCVSSFSKTTGEESLLLAHMHDGITNVVAEYNKCLDAWIVENNISKKFIIDILLKDKQEEEIIANCNITLKEIDDKEA